MGEQLTNSYYPNLNIKSLLFVYMYFHSNISFIGINMFDVDVAFILLVKWVESMWGYVIFLLSRQCNT